MIALLAALLWAPLSPPPAAVPVVLVGDGWTPAREAAAVAEARAALAWWGEAPALDVRRLDVAEPYAPETWLPATGDGAIYLVAREPGGPLLSGGHSGRARRGLAVALETPALGPLAALIAHEWGHAAHGLPDLDGAEADIMAGGYRTAYAMGRVGCRSLKALGRPCGRVWLPLVGAEGAQHGADAGLGRGGKQQEGNLNAGRAVKRRVSQVHAAVGVEGINHSLYVLPLKPAPRDLGLGQTKPLASRKSERRSAALKYVAGKNARARGVIYPYAIYAVIDWQAIANPSECIKQPLAVVHTSSFAPHSSTRRPA